MKAIASILFASVMAFAAPAFVFADGAWTDVSWTVTGTQVGDTFYSADGSCSVDSGSHASWYRDVYDGSIGSSTLLYGNLYSVAGTQSCAFTPVAGHTYYAVVVAPASVVAFRTYMETGGGTPPTDQYSRIEITPSAYAIDWGAISFPLIYDGSTTALAASSSLWGSLAVASTTLSCSSGNIFSDGLCSALSFLFVPNPGIVSAFGDLASTTLPTKFPISWVYGTAATFDSLSASSTANFTPMSFDFHTMGVGSTSPLGLANIAPDITVFSSTTVMKYIPQGVWDAGQSLIGFVIILGLLADIFFTTRNEMHRV